jgi:MEDS: MEthanogen/methylotroph, DcmR Sensory domain
MASDYERGRLSTFNYEFNNSNIEEASMSNVLSMASRRVDVPPEEYVRNIEGGEHGVIFYTSKQDMRKIHFAFVKSGLENNWGVIYAAPGSYSEDLRYGMQNYGIDVKKYEEEGSLTIQKGEDIYKDPVKPDLELFKKQSNDIINFFLSKGKKGVKIATDLTSFFLPHGLYISLFDVEHLFKPRTDLPLTLICAYDAAIIPSVKDIDIAFFYKQINKEWRKFVDAHSFAIYTAKGKDIIFTI